MTAYVFLRDYRGVPYFESSITGDEIPAATIDLPKVAPGGSHTQTITIGKTLIETEADEEYQVVIEIRDDEGDKLDQAKWTHD